MKLKKFVIGAAMLAAGMATTNVATARERLTEEARVAQLTSGRVAGKPVSCITAHDIRSSEIVDRTAIVYTMNNGTIYVNRPNIGASTLDDDDIMINRLYTSQLCRIDIVETIDRYSHFVSGSIGLGDFVPYPRPPKVASN